ncbi:MAG: hypothetical protein JWR61_1640 [Ferruginibacter sp.]|jgi:hypothetical protein|nr:hypothetical protein [Ferruginibacter sp.]
MDATKHCHPVLYLAVAITYKQVNILAAKEYRNGNCFNP